MCTINEITRLLKPAVFANGEVLYNIIDFIDCIKVKQEKHLGLDDENTILIPYYLENGRRMELYEYTLTISLSSQLGFERHILNITKRNRVSEIPEDLLHLYRACYIECQKSRDGECYVIKEELQKYFEFLLDNQTLSSGVKIRCERFDKKTYGLKFVRGGHGDADMGTVRDH